MASKSSYLAQPSGACCLTGNIHEGNAQGTFADIAGIDTYIAKPEEGKANGNIVLYFPDVYGLFNNGLLIMDGFASAGYVALGLDYFKGDPVTKHRKNKDDTTTEPDFDFEEWKDKHTASASEIVPRWVKAVKDLYAKAGTKFACVGYCFGAPYVCDELAGDVCLAGAFAHPAFLKEHHFFSLKSTASSLVRGSYLTIIAPEPLFLSCAETDATFPTEARNRSIDILRNNKKPYQLQLFSGVAHGFALRCDLDVPYERYCKEQSLKGIVDFFDFHLSN